MTTPTPPQRKKPAPLSEQAKHIIRTQRRALSNEMSAWAAERASASKAFMDRTYKPRPLYTQRVATFASAGDSTRTNFHQTIVPRATAVLASERVRAGLQVDISPRVERSAMTDFNTIWVNLPITENTDIAEAAAVLRGMIYHEGGHCRWSTPLQDLYDAYVADTAIDQAKRDKVQALTVKQLHYPWNLAEDQRMEMLVVDDSPRKAVYFTPMVLDLVLNFASSTATPKDRKAAYEKQAKELESYGIQIPAYDKSKDDVMRVAGYPLVAWRRYLPKAIRREMRRMFIDVHGIDKTRLIESCILRYLRATTVEQAIDAIVDLLEPLEQTMAPTSGIDNHQYIVVRRGRGGSGEPIELPENATLIFVDDDDDDDDEDGDDGESQGQGQGVAREDKGKDFQPGIPSKAQAGDKAPTPSKPSKPSKAPKQLDGDDEGDEGDEGDDEVKHGDGYSASGGSDTNHSGDDLADRLAQAAEDAKAARNADASVQNDVRAFNSGVFGGGEGSTLLPYHTTNETDPHIIGKAQGLANQMIQAFREVTVEAQPTWQEQQTRGVLNVGRYMTHAPGDREYFRSWAEEIAPGHNVAVSVLLDYSGSMGGSTVALAQVAYGMKAACDEIGIPCTTLLWDHEATLLFKGDERCTGVPVINAAGGTSPKTALDDTPNHRYDKDKHIILVMTDGQFHNTPNWLDQYRTEGCYFIGVIYGSEGGSGAATQMATMGFDVYQCVSTLDPLVGLLEQAIIDMSTSV